MTHTHNTEERVFENKNHHFRIPALLYIKEWQTFVAFTEKRSSTKDEDAESLVLRTGKRECDSTVKWSSPLELEKAHFTKKKIKYRPMNPCPVFDKSTKTLYLFFICIKGKTWESCLAPGDTRLCYITSQDEELKTWTTLKDVTDDIQVAKKKLSGYKTFAVGPGHGLVVETSSGSGRRLLIPAYVKMNDGSHSVVFHSDDGGETWQAGQPLSQVSGECQVAEVKGPEGTKLYCNARTGGKFCMEALGDDTGNCFTPLSPFSLPETPHGCQGSVLAFPAPGQALSTQLLFSHPTKGSGWTRRDLGIYRRESLQGRWSKPYIIHKGISGYSDLAQCEEEDRFACLMECGEAKPLQIVFKEFSLSEITEQSEVNQCVSSESSYSPCCSQCSPCCRCSQCCSCCLL